jgi:CRP/FNR family transcriptional regulator, cyclic AMP receptor protein
VLPRKVARMTVAMRSRSHLGVWAELASLGAERRLRPGDWLVRQGAPADAVHLILEGSAKTIVDMHSGRDLTLALPRVGDLVADAEVLGGAPVLFATVIALESLVTRRVPASRFLDFLVGHPAAAAAVATSLATRLSASDRRRVAAASLSVPRRLAAHLVELAHSPDGISDSAQVVLSQVELASLMATSRDTTIRGLRQLRALGLVRTQRRVILVQSVERLRDYALGGTR